MAVEARRYCLKETSGNGASTLAKPLAGLTVPTMGFTGRRARGPSKSRSSCAPSFTSVVPEIASQATAGKCDRLSQR
jgi:hypothetical protein